MLKRRPVGVWVERHPPLTAALVIGYHLCLPGLAVTPTIDGFRGWTLTHLASRRTLAVRVTTPAKAAEVAKRLVEINWKAQAVHLKCTDDVKEAVRRAALAEGLTLTPRGWFEVPPVAEESETTT